MRINDNFAAALGSVNRARLKQYLCHLQEEGGDEIDPALAPCVRDVLLNYDRCEVVLAFHMVVSGAGLEPARLSPYAPQTYASANSAIPTPGGILHQ